MAVGEKVRKEALYQILMDVAAVARRCGEDGNTGGFLQTVCDRMVESDLFPGTCIAVAEADQQFHVHFLGTMQAPKFTLPVYPESPNEDGIFARAWHTGGFILSREYLKEFPHNRRLQQAVGKEWRSLCAVPIWRGGQPWGVLAAIADNASFEETLSTLFIWIAEEIGRTLSAADTGIYRGKQQQLQRLGRFYEAIAVVGEGLRDVEDEHTLLEKACQTLVGEGMFDGSWIGAPDSLGVFQPYASAGDGVAEYLARVTISTGDGPEGGSCVGRAWRLRRTVVENDWPLTRRMVPWRAAAMALGGWRASAAFFIARGDKPWALLTVYSRRPNAFDIEALELGERFTRILGRALDHHDKSRQLARSHALYAALTRTGEIVRDKVREGDDLSLLKAACQTLAGGPLFHSAWVGSPGDDGTVHYLAMAGSCEDLLPRVDDPRGEPVTVRAWRSQSLYYCEDTLADPSLAGWHEHLEMARWMSMASVPLLRDGGIWAVLTVVSAERHPFGDETLDLMRRLSELLGHGLDEIDRAKVLSAAREKEQWLATHDTLTGLPNRAVLDFLLPQARARADREEKLLAVVFIDLDGFKPINDRFGHEAGDIVLQEVAAHIRDHLRAGDTALRIGGDEFLLLLGDLKSLGDFDAAIARICAAIPTPVVLRDAVVRVAASCGATLYPMDDAEPEMLLRHADFALYAHKSLKGQPRGDYQLYLPEMGDIARDGIHARSRVMQILDGGGLNLGYQPILSTANGRITAVEGVARLMRDGVPVEPEAFLGGLGATEIRRLGRAVRSMAVAQAAEWHAAGLKLAVSINITPDELLDPGLAGHIFDLLARYPQLPPSAITLDLLESADTLNHTDTLERLQRLRGAGICIALDDVCSIHSSLLRLKTLPINEIKVDQGFVRDLPFHPGDIDFLDGLIRLGRAMDALITIDGVETAAHLAALSELEVDYLQGHAIGRPQEAGDIPRFVRNFRPPSPDPESAFAAFERHLNWLHWLETGVLVAPQDIPLDKLANGCDCAFGRWLAAQDPTTPSVRRIRRHHDAAHRAAVAAIHAALEGQKALTRRRLRILRGHSRRLAQEMATATRTLPPDPA